MVMQMPLIDRDALINALGKQRLDEPKHRRTIMRSIQLVMEQPKVDAVPVVRCRVCKWYRPLIASNGLCVRLGACIENFVEEYDFCSDGERRTE